MAHIRASHPWALLPVGYRAREEEPARPAHPRRSSPRRPAAFLQENGIATRDPSLEAQAKEGRRRLAMVVTTDEDAANLELPAQALRRRINQGRRDVIVTDSQADPSESIVD